MPRHKMKNYEIFIGVWNTRGEVLATRNAPANVLTATDTYRWLLGKHFVMHEVDARFGDQPSRSMEVMGFDPASRKHFATSYDDQGLSEHYRVKLRGRHWTIVGESARFDGKFSSSGDLLKGLWELKTDDVWEPWIALELRRA